MLPVAHACPVFVLQQVIAAGQLNWSETFNKNADANHKLPYWIMNMSYCPVNESMQLQDILCFHYEGYNLYLFIHNWKLSHCTALTMKYVC